jgi:UDP-N-acetylmuramoyl-tripeptide--D-alanyl-D-alanine ligase
MLTLGEIASLLGVTPPDAAETAPRRVVHDSRVVGPGDLFVALPGARTDGHAFLGAVFRRGACGAILSDPTQAPEGAGGLIVVEDGVLALRRLASAWRDRLTSTLIGVTGSHGKTTTRSLLAHLLRSSFRIYEAPGNFNTEIGLPLALLNMPASASIGVFELGTERPGDIALLASILRPSVGILTGVGPSHLGGLGSLEAIAVEKWSLIDALDHDDVAFLNADAGELRTRIPAARCRIQTVGLTHGSFRGSIESAVPDLVIRLDEPPLRLETRLLGSENARNVLLAVACALQLGVSPAEIETAARTYEPPPHRLRPRPTSFGILLDDTYNANPTSMRLALRVLADYGSEGARRVFVFGDMLDLGKASKRLHAETADLAESLGIDLVLPAGPRAATACAGRDATDGSLLEAENRRDVLLSHLAGPNNVVLIKGSRALALDELVAEILTTTGTNVPSTGG